tara:strand:+ start:397 stop:603 length:207 start_codon:yes stop_codon:yes gene_type:complete
MKNIKINETPYVRDADSKAILNTNRNALQNYKIARQKKIDEINDINNMKKDIAELKEMIKTLLGKQHG